jgi:hypothetical protein
VLHFLYHFLSTTWSPLIITAYTSVSEHNINTVMPKMFLISLWILVWRRCRSFQIWEDVYTSLVSICSTVALRLIYSFSCCVLKDVHNLSIIFSVSFLIPCSSVFDYQCPHSLRLMPANARLLGWQVWIPPEY